MNSTNPPIVQLMTPSGEAIGLADLAVLGERACEILEWATDNTATKGEAWRHWFGQRLQSDPDFAHSCAVAISGLGEHIFPALYERLEKRGISFDEVRAIMVDAFDKQQEAK